MEGGTARGQARMDAVYPAGASALARGRRRRRAEPRARRTTPVTFAEIKEVDEESEEIGAGEARGSEACEARGSEACLARRRPDLLEERLGRQFAEFRRRRARVALRELSPPPSPPPCPERATSEPALT